MPQHTSHILEQIDTLGYCVVPNVIGTDEADRARGILHQLLAAEITDEARQAGTQRVGSLATKDPMFLELLCHPLVIEVWQRLLGEDIICSSWSANTLYPGHDRMGWHADYPYWSKQPPWPAGHLAGQTVWMLDDFTLENGATAVVPGSHRKGHPPEEPRNRWRDDGQVVTGQRGSVVLAHGRGGIPPVPITPMRRVPVCWGCTSCRGSCLRRTWEHNWQNWKRHRSWWRNC
tara:strand:+ start:282 stop:977 length:696 start_codon:yes stop_codon:yes gene_type:complete